MARKVWLAVVVAMMTAACVGTSSAADEKIGVRFRGIYVKPAESFDSALASVNPKIGDDVIPEVDLEYFFTKNFSVEAIAGVTRNEIKCAGDLTGSTWLLPPTVTLKYHPFAGSAVSPYVGFGANAIFPFNSRLNGTTNFDIDNSFGWAAQAGADFKVAEHLYFNVDYKYLNADTKIAFNKGAKLKLDLNPNLFGIGLGYRF